MTDINEKELSILRLAHEEFTPRAAERARVRAALATTLGAAAATAAGSAAAAASGATNASAAASGTGAATLGGAASAGATTLGGAASTGAATLGGALGTSLLAVSTPKLVIGALGAVGAGVLALQGPSNTASHVAESPPSGPPPDAAGPLHSGKVGRHALGPASAHEPAPRPEETRPTAVQKRDEAAAQHATRTAMRAEPIAVAPQTGPADPLLGAELTLLARARRSLNQGDGATALQVLAQLDENYPRGTFIEERRATLVLALCTMGQVARGRAEMRGFAAQYPQSVYADRIRSSCNTK